MVGSDSVGTKRTRVAYEGLHGLSAERMSNRALVISKKKRLGSI
jgi:hypothetical protein